MRSHFSGKRNQVNLNNNNFSLKECSVRINDLSSPNNCISQLNKLCGNGNVKNIYKCKSKLCKLNHNFCAKDKAVSTATKRIYDCVVPPGTIYVDCHSSNVIYLITCNKCFLQYVGETAQALNARFNGHRAGIKNPSKNGFCRILSEHFNKGHCKNATYNVQILEKLEGTGRTSRGALDASQTSKRKARELYWILKLRTAYPYGLNDRLGDEFTKCSANEGLIGKKFPPLSRKHLRFSRGSHIKQNNTKPNEFFNKFLYNLKHDRPNIHNFCRVSLLAMNKGSLKKVAILLNDQINKDRGNNLQWLLAALDIIESKIYVVPHAKPKRKPPKNLCKILFDNKAIEYINIPRIFHEQSTQSALPPNINNFETPTVIFNLEPPIYSKIFNFNKFVSHLDLPAFLKDNTILPCNCAGSQYIDRHHHHILTGNLNIIENNKLRNLFQKGPKFRESKPIDWEKARTNILTGVNSCIKDWCYKHGYNEVIFNEWKAKITESIDSRISILSQKITTTKTKLIGQDHMAMQHLKHLHNNYVITPIDKASGNVAIICKRFYAQVLIKELGIEKQNSTNAGNTYLQINKNPDNIINNHANVLKKKFNISIDNDNKKLPHMYWLPKLHKIPSKSRFIVAATNCSVKPLSKAVTAALKLLYKQIESYHQKSFYFSGVKSFWPIQDNSSVIKNINKLNTRNRAKSITTFDFSTLYTSIPHDKLKNALREVINFGFKGGDKFYIGINKYGAKWVNDKSSCPVTFDKASLKLAINFLLDQCYFNVGNLIFRQVIGIPMGSDPAPFMANLFLYFYENKWLESTKKHDLIKSRKFANVFRFIDDLCAINDSFEFRKNFKNIYPPELELKEENTSPTQASFLDLSISIVDNKFHTSLFDKRDAFPFSIVRMPYLCSNMPSKIFYATVGSEILRFARTNTNQNQFLKDVKVLLNRMKKQGCKRSLLKKVLNKMYGRHLNDFQKFADTAKQFIELCNLI